MNNLVLPPDKNSKPIPVLGIGLAQDVTNGKYMCTDGVARITAITESRVWYHNNVKAGSGFLLPAGASVDVNIESGKYLEVSGSVNITKYI